MNVAKSWRSLTEAQLNPGEIEKLAQRLIRIEARIDDLKRLIDDHVIYRDQIQYRDLLLLIDRAVHWRGKEEVRIETKHPVAIASHDHLFPRGTVNDNTRYPRFVKACERVLGRKLAALDVGCAGGGMVLEFLLEGHRAFGVEGSDTSAKSLRAEWRLLGDRLFTADATKPFAIMEGTDRLAFDLICAWEVMEHIPEHLLPGLLHNVTDHLAPDGLFVGSVAMFPDEDPATGAVWHVTLRGKTWWRERFADAGLEMLEDHGFEPRDFPRGNPHGQYLADFVSNPEMGFHFVCRAR